MEVNKAFIYLFKSNRTPTKPPPAHGTIGTNILLSSYKYKVRRQLLPQCFYLTSFHLGPTVVFDTIATSRTTIIALFTLTIKWDYTLLLVLTLVRGNVTSFASPRMCSFVRQKLRDCAIFWLP